MDNRPIGIFDSGIGGLTVFKEILKELPNENIIYLGDTARVPYGTRSKEIIKKFALELVDFLLKKNVKCLVVSCNTISSTCLSEIIKYTKIPVIGVVDPVVTEAAVKTENKKIGVIGTSATIESGMYESRLREVDKDIKVFTQTGSLFIPLIEEGFSSHEAARQIAKEYLKRFDNTGIDTLILGCTHFPLMTKIISEIMGFKVILVDSAKPTAKELKKLLSEEDLLSDNSLPVYQIFVTDAPDRVYEVAQRFFGNKLPVKPKKVIL